MCGRYTLRLPDRLAELMTEKQSGDIPAALAKPRFNIGPGQKILFLQSANPTSMILEGGLWGWPKPGDKGSGLLINARLETAAGKATFRQAWQKNRVLVPADGYYEWQRDDRPPRPFHCHLPNDQIWWMAGLALPAAAGEDSRVLLLTQPAHSPVDRIHHRMPVLFDLSEGQAWLSSSPFPEPTDSIPILAGTRSIVDQLQIREVSTRVNHRDHEGAECLHPPPTEQLDLPW